MAVTITSQPSEISPIGNGVQFELYLDASGNGSNLVYTIGHFLRDEDDNVITDVERIDYTGLPEPVDFTEDIKPLIYTTIQQPGSSPALDLDANFQKVFYLTYGTLVYDIDACEVSEATDISTQSEDFTVINSAFQWWEEGFDQLASGQTFVLTDMVEGVFLNIFQKVNYVAPDQDLFLWVYRQAGVGNIRVAKTFLDVDNNVLDSSVTTVTASGAHVIAISPDITTYPTITKYRIDVRQDSTTPVKVFDFLVQDCGDARIRELHWIGTKGGQESLVFDTVQEGINTVGKVYDNYTPINKTPAEYGLNYGKSRVNVKSFKQITMQRTMLNQADQFRLLDGLFSSGLHYVKYPTATGYTLCKFILQDGQYQVSDNKESILITVTGEIHLPINRV